MERNRMDKTAKLDRQSDESRKGRFFTEKFRLRLGTTTIPMGGISFQ